MKAKFRSAVGNLHWVTPQSRWDRAVDTSRLQKKQNGPVWADYKALGKAVAQVKESAEVALRIRRLRKPVLGVWSDSSLYGSSGDPLEDPDVTSFDRHQVHSQWGYVLGFLEADDLNKTTDIPVSIVDWKSRSSKRVFHSTLATESGAAVEALGQACYMRAYYCGLLFGRQPG